MRSPLVVLIALALACGGDQATTLAGPDPEIPEQPVTPQLAVTVSAGAGQSAVVGTELPNPIVVTVMDTSGGVQSATAVSGQIVNFVVTGGGGTVFAGSNKTNAQGQIQERWTLGDVVGTQTLEARAVDATTGAPIVFAKITAMALDHPIPNHLEYSIDFPDSIPADVPFDVATVVSVWESDSTDTKVRDIPFSPVLDWRSLSSFPDPDRPTTIPCTIASTTITCGASSGLWGGHVYEIVVTATDPAGDAWTSPRNDFTTY